MVPPRSRPERLRTVILCCAPQETPIQLQMEEVVVMDQFVVRMFEGSEVILALNDTSASSSDWLKQQDAENVSNIRAEAVIAL